MIQKYRKNGQLYLLMSFVMMGVLFIVLRKPMNNNRKLGYYQTY